VNLRNAITLLARLKIKHRDTGRTVPFRLNTNQEKAMRELQEQYDEIGMIRCIILKARRVGMSSLMDSLGLLHCLHRPQAHAKIVAHLQSTAEGLFRVPRDLVGGLPYGKTVVDVRTRRIIVPHPDGDSILDISTAGSVIGGRGLTLSFVHLSEAAFFPGEDSFLSLLPAVSDGDDTFVAIESTANGRVGPGKAFYDFWNSAVAGKNGYVPIFLPWLDDPACVRPSEEASDAPANDIERELMRDFKASKAQIAWFRRTLEDKCQGILPKMMQEYPHSPEVAFIASGDPAFPREEIIYVRSTVEKPIKRGRVRWDGNVNRVVLEEVRGGLLHIWRLPEPRHYYYIGADAATGLQQSEESLAEYATGDFAAYVVFDGTTGELVARYADRIHPEHLAEQLYHIGNFYNKAMINIELTGNLGRHALKVLRDHLGYNNFYLWKGKDDRAPGRKSAMPLIGWETTSVSRRKLFDTFRAGIRSGMRNEEGGLAIYDDAIVQQMDAATFREGFRWEVEYGHDDILFAGMLAVIALSQWPPPRITNRSRKPDIDEGQTYSPLNALGIRPQEPVEHSLRNHYRLTMKAMRLASGKPGAGLDGI
jgi:hypothetical protein